jgi:hypothetical protein
MYKEIVIIKKTLGIYPREVSAINEAYQGGFHVGFTNDKKQAEKYSIIFDGGINIQDFKSSWPESMIIQLQELKKGFIITNGSRYQYAYIYEQNQGK